MLHSGVDEDCWARDKCALKRIDTEKRDIPQVIEIWEDRLADPCFVYVLGPTDDQQVIKIGKARDPFARLRGLQTGHPDQLVIYCVMPGDRWLEEELRRKALALGAEETYGGSEWLRLDDSNDDVIHAFLAGLAERYIEMWDGTASMPVLPPFHDEDPVERERRWEKLREVASYCFHVDELAEELGRDPDSVHADCVRLAQLHRPVMFRWHDIELAQVKRTGFAKLGYSGRVG